ncbi:MAG TPA: UbiA family prenyltransferase [Symbiobacteriaceae bacterium]|nr:UbiA family prenyltransferase [Symbiobacteriaceae bacterium]
MRKLLLLLELGKPRILVLMCGLTLAGAVLSPDFLSPAFPQTRLGGTALFRQLERVLPQAFSPPMWSLWHALGAALIVGLLWLGTALINDIADRSVDAISSPERPLPSSRIRPSEALRWALGFQAIAFLLILIEGSRHAMTLALLGAGLGNTYSLPPFRLRQNGPVANLIIGGGVMLAMCGGMIAQTGVTEVGLFSAAALGLLAAAVSMIKDFKDIDGDRLAGIRTLPILVGVRTALAINMAVVVVAYLLALYLLLQTIGMQEKAIALFGLPLAANLYVLHRLRENHSQENARQAYRHAVIIFMGVTVLYVGAQAVY